MSNFHAAQGLVTIPKPYFIQRVGQETLVLWNRAGETLVPKYRSGQETVGGRDDQVKNSWSFGGGLGIVIIPVTRSNGECTVVSNSAP